jgi:bifunctional non-homologous end joining protein LigD
MRWSNVEVAEDIAPMLARLASSLPPNDSAFGYEFKWDGYRAIVYLEGGLRVMSRGAQDYTRRFPELHGLPAGAGRSMVLDGEIIALGVEQSSSFQRLQWRSGAGSDEEIRRRAEVQPVAYMIFDLLRLEGRPVMPRPYTERRARLEALGLEGPAWWVPPYRAGGGREMFEASRRLNYEGVVAKRLTSIYVPGARSSDWLKVKNHRRQELVIVGYTSGRGARQGHIGALLVAYYDRPGPEGRLIYAGKVGTGYTKQTLEMLKAKLAPLRRDTSPLDAGKPPRDAVFVEPVLVCEVEFTEWTRDGTLRHPSFKGLRDDKDPREVIREEELPPPPK